MGAVETLNFGTQAVIERLQQLGRSATQRCTIEVNGRCSAGCQQYRAHRIIHALGTEVCIGAHGHSGPFTAWIGE